MSETVIVAIISLAGTLFGTLGGIVASGKLTGYRIDRLEVQDLGLEGQRGEIHLYPLVHSIVAPDGHQWTRCYHRLVYSALGHHDQEGIQRVIPTLSQD